VFLNENIQLPIITYRTRASAIIIRDDRVLLVKHNDASHDEEWWCLPGGTVEFGESVSECAEREVLEETNLSVMVNHLMYVHDVIHIHANSYKRDFCFSIDHCSGNLLAPRGETYPHEARYFSREEISVESTRCSVVPRILRDRFWIDLKRLNLGVQYLGITLLS